MSEKKQLSHDHEEEEEDRIASLNSLVTSLQLRLQELEAQYANLSSRLSSCTCSSEKEKRESNGSIEKVTGSESTCFDHNTATEKKKKTKKKKSKEKVAGYDISVMNHICKRFVALKIMYFGQRFYGFASEAQMDPTVESELFGALEKTRLVVGDKKNWKYSRCGRTDKGVSSVGQVVALFLRSNLKKFCLRNGNFSETVPIEQLEGELDYVRVLNRVLPNDIRVLGWSPVPIGFSARFSCLSREYKYFFWEDNLNISAMRSAGKKFIGEHDFRNFCKMDALNVHNYRRHVTIFAISLSDVRFQGNQLWAITIRGSAFLWHQVRCMVAVLFMIGQGFESPDVIDALLDTDRITKKPQYIMAPELPLVLHSCEFDNIKFICSSDSGLALNQHLVKECQTYNLQAAIFREALVTSFPMSTDETASDKPRIKKANHVPLMSRPTEPSYEERRIKMISKK